MADQDSSSENDQEKGGPVSLDSTRLDLGISSILEPEPQNGSNGHEIGSDEPETNGQVCIDSHISGLISRRTAKRPASDLSSSATNGIERLDLKYEGDEEKEPEPTSELTQLALNKKWKELAERSERQMGDDNDQEARLRWVQSQMRIGGVPATILAAPLDSASQQVFAEESENQLLTSLTVELLAELSKDLKALEEWDIALEFLSRAAEQDGSLRESLLELVNGALRVKKGIPKFKRDEACEKSIEALQLQQRELRRGLRQEPEPSSMTDEAVEQLSEPAGLKQNSLTVSRKFVGWGATLCIIFLAGSALRYTFQLIFGEGPQAIFAYELSGTEILTPRAVLPEIKRMAGHGYLDALLYDLKDSSPSESQKVAKRDAGSAPAVSRSNGRRKARIDMSGPIEPVSMRKRHRRRHTEDSSVPVVDENYVKGFPGRKPVVAYPVTRFSPPKDYKLIVETEVHDRPSFKSRVQERVDSGKYIRVIEDLGPWLRLEGGSGRTGYIPSENAVPVKG